MDKHNYINKIYYILLSSIILVMDLYSKRYIYSIFYLGQCNKINFFLNLKYTKNFGCAFNIFSNRVIWEIYLIIFINIYLLINLLKLIYDNHNNYFENIIYTIILSGALSNLINRINYGFIIDFIDLHYNKYHIPIFNIADISIFIGIITYIINIIIKK